MRKPGWVTFDCVFCGGETTLPPMSCVCGAMHHVCAVCENKYTDMMALDLSICPKSKEFKVAEELMGEEREDDLKALVRSARKAIRAWGKENPY